MNYNIFGDKAPMAPTLGKGTECIKLLCSQASNDMISPLIPMFFPALEAHLRNSEFLYPDQTWKETCGMMANLVAESGGNKGQLTALVEAICKDFRGHDEGEIRRLVEWQRVMKTRGANKEKPARPEVALYFPPSDVTNPAFLQNAMALEAQGGDQFFAEPALNIADWFSTDLDGKGCINILDCRELANNGLLYSAFLLWMLSELFETLPEVGDADKPRMVFFFDEAHLMFDGISKALEDKVEQIVKLIRSKGVGIYFITQNPTDIPDGILSQLGNKIQHALRAYTPSDEKAVKAAASSFRVNPAFDTKKELTALGTGEALISVLGEDGIPGIVQKCRILPPQSLMGPIPDGEKKQEALVSKLYWKYEKMEDRDSAYEFFQRKKMQDDEAAAKARQEAEAAKEARKEASKRQKAVNSSVRRAANTAAGTIGRELGNSLGKQVGGSFGKKLGGNVGASLGRSILGTFLKF